MATGHTLGDTSDFSNTIYSGFQVPGAGYSLMPFLESDVVLGDVLPRSLARIALTRKVGSLLELVESLIAWIRSSARNRYNPLTRLIW